MQANATETWRTASFRDFNTQAVWLFQIGAKNISIKNHYLNLTFSMSFLFEMSNLFSFWKNYNTWSLLQVNRETMQWFKITLPHVCYTFFFLLCPPTLQNKQEKVFAYSVLYLCLRLKKETEEKCVCVVEITAPAQSDEPREEAWSNDKISTSQWPPIKTSWGLHSIKA